MAKKIEVVVSPKGETSVKTEGFAGAECLEATKFLERTLGRVFGERKTGEFYAAAQTDQQVRE